ncbi:myosin [Fusarium tjaetaba]|uniref:Myosin n=1 Tax=Fusarium tjaetaba TaxID=1567544 RepID=A0A8H5W0D6_9HYPO|nr:myosin [Fusarium tjaetaba]KAF5644297.1 myosin [Fusarium tjaetaba]
MSHLLWKSYWENDVDRFRRLLAPTSYNAQSLSKSPAIGGSGALFGGSPGLPGTSPRPANKQRRVSGHPQTPGKSKDGNTHLGRTEVNSRDHAGLTVLLRAASSTDPNAHQFVQALVEHPAIDLYVQDPESGWNALHRSLYAGNVSIARLLLEKERVDLTSHNLNAVNKVGLLIKTKDHEGNSPFDVYNSTIAARSLKGLENGSNSDSDADSVDSGGDGLHYMGKTSHGLRSSIDGDELFVFGSNKNVSLGVGDEDDRQYPDRIHLSRPELLVHRLYHSHLDEQDEEAPSLLKLDEIPTLVRNRPLVIQDVSMSKLHSAILTTDPVSNLYVCGVGRGGRLGLGDENTQFRFVPVEGPFIDKRIHQVALGQNHTMAVVDNGELWTWGLNSASQLGYALPPPMKADEEPMSLTPRQVFGSLKKEVVLGVAASANHSVAHTGNSLFTWGRNVGQLALMDADSRSLDIQHTPRKVAASLLAAPIEMVSAIDKATICLLSNHTVWVFSHYGYNLVKFPFPDVFANNISMTRYESGGRREIDHITAGGETIAAVTARGDLFTFHLNDKGDPSQSAASTTNPVKIKNALTQPQCVWDSRKDGVVSVGVGEHGSVIICTESGAVWNRVKRTKGKLTGFSASSGTKRKDFKFQRVPYITNCVAVRSSIFGAFAAIRKDSKVMAEEIEIEGQSLRDDIGSLLCLNGFEAPQHHPEAKGSQKTWETAIIREKRDPVPYEILRSADIEKDLGRWLETNSFRYDDMNMAICSSSLPDIKIPVHSWALAGRSPVLRHALSELRERGSVFSTDSFGLEVVDDRVLLTLFEVDIYTVLNVVVHAYQDRFVPVWKYTREAPPLAFRFRQVRTELMKVATNLALPKLEAAVRLQTGAEESLDSDFKQAILDPSFFDDGDVIIELDGEDVMAHSQLLCQRCPFFEALFNGRSQGQWLAGRRDGMDSAEKIRVDLSHIDPETFKYVMSFIYADIGRELFDTVSVSNLDELSELVLDVMSAANELMLDRLSQVCQGLIGKFVTTRNISNLLNEISPCSITEFKDTGLEYICLQLESMLENHLLDDLDEDLLLELDEVVRDNQLARFPFVRSGRAELLLHESHPELAADIDEERQARIKEMAYKASQRDDEKKLSSSFKARMGSLDEGSPLQTPDTTRRKYRGGRNEPFSPSLRPKQSQADMIFDMEDENGSLSAKPRSPLNEAVNLRSPPELDDMPQLPKAWRESKGKELVGSAISPVPHAFSMSPESQPFELGSLKTPGSGMSKPGAPWSASKLATSKLDLKDIMSEASTSALTAGLQAQRKQEAAANKPQTKVSQKERKRQLQALAAAEAAAKDESTNHVPWESVPEGGRPAPWKAASPAPKTSLKEAMSAETNMPKGVSANAKPLVASETRARTATRRTASPDTRFPGQGRTNSSPAIVAGPSTEQQPKKPLVPHSKSYITPAPKAEPTLGFSMADIIGQQKREQEAVKEAVARRSLQEIQQEQAFQEWWDQESRRTQEEEARRKQKEGREKDKDNKGTKRGGRRGRGGKAKGTGEAATNSGQSGANGSRGGGTAGSSNTTTRGSGGGRGGGGVGGGRGRGGKGRGNKPQAA